MSEFLCNHPLNYYTMSSLTVVPAAYGAQAAPSQLPTSLAVGGFKAESGPSTAEKLQVREVQVPDQVSEIADNVSDEDIQKIKDAGEQFLNNYNNNQKRDYDWMELIKEFGPMVKELAGMLKKRDFGDMKKNVAAVSSMIGSFGVDQSELSDLLNKLKPIAEEIKGTVQKRGLDTALKTRDWDDLANKLEPIVQEIKGQLQKRDWASELSKLEPMLNSVMNKMQKRSLEKRDFLSIIGELIKEVQGILSGILKGPSGSGSSGESPGTSPSNGTATNTTALY